MQSTEIKPGVYWVGAIDWSVRDFHGYSTPEGSTYNAFLVVDEKIALFDTVKKPFKDDLLRQIAQIVDPSKIDYIVANHIELDHTGALPEVMEVVKPEKLICSPNGKTALVRHFHREDWPYEITDSLSLGKKTVRFIKTPMLHWPDSMMSYIPEDRLLISQDGFGQHWATSERFDDEVDSGELMYQSAKYYANILLPYSSLVQKLIGDVSMQGLDIDMIAPDHGLIWRKHPEKIVQAWNDWSRQVTKPKAIVVYDTMWQSTATMAKAVADGIQENGVSVKLMWMESCHRSDVITELLDARAVVFGSPTLNNGILPRMADVLSYIKGLKPAAKIGAAFGSFGWGGESVKLLNAAMEEMKFDIIDPGVRAQYVPTDAEIDQCRELGREVAEAVKEG